VRVGSATALSLEIVAGLLIGSAIYLATARGTQRIPIEPDE